MAYIGSSPTKVVSRQSANIFTYTATANQTAFTGADANGNTLACSPSDLMVHMNGIKLEESDYTATTTTVTLGSGAAAGDEVTITAFLTFESADHYTKSAADTRYDNASGDTMSGDLSVTGADVTITGSTNTDATLNVLSPNWVTGAYADINISYQPTSRKIRGHYDNGIEIFTNNANAALQVDPNGRVTMPYQPSFYATFSGGTANTNITTYQTPLVNVGSHFNSTTGVFTAPVSGKFLFFAAVMTDNAGSYHWFRFKKNGSYYGSYHHSQSDTADAYRHTSGSLIMDMSINDTCILFVAAANPYSGGNEWSSFGGYLLG